MATLTATPSNPNKTLSLLGIALLIAGFGGSYYFLVPKLQTARTDKATATSTEKGLVQDVATLQQAQRDLGSAQSALEAKGVDFAAIPSHIPPTEDLPNLYIQMENLVAVNQGVKKLEYQLAQPVTDPSGKGAKIGISITGIGSYTAIKGLIMMLENNIRPVIITQIGLSAYTAVDSQKDVPDGSYTVSISAYTLAQNLSSAYAIPTGK